MQWGIIGTGSIAHHFIEDLRLVASPQQVTAVLGHTKEHTEEFAKQYNIPAHFTRLDDFIKSGIDAAYIATPHPQHYENALACLSKGISVLCEKPITLNKEQCEELVATSRNNHCFLMEGMWIRFLPSLKQVLSLIETGRIGKIHSIRADISFRAPADKKNRFFNPVLGGGSLLDLGVYPVFLSYLLLGKPSVIKAIATLTDEGVDEMCSVLFQYPGKQQATLACSLVEQYERPAEISGEKGIIRLLHPWFEKSTGIELQEYEAGKTVFPCEWDGHGLQFETEEVIRCVEAKKIESDLLSHRMSIDMMEIMDGIRKQVQVEYEMYE